MFYCEQIKTAKRSSDPLRRKEAVGNDVGVRNFPCKPQSGDAQESLFFFFFLCVEQTGMEKGKERADGRDGKASVNSYLLVV